MSDTNNMSDFGQKMAQASVNFRDSKKADEKLLNTLERIADSLEGIVTILETRTLHVATYNQGK